MLGGGVNLQPADGINLEAWAHQQNPTEPLSHQPFLSYLSCTQRSLPPPSSFSSTMKFSTAAVLVALPALASAHKNNLDARHHVRQAPAGAAASSSVPATSKPAATTPAATGAASGSGGVGPSVSLLSTGSTAIPLSSIVAGAPPQSTHPVPTSPAAGAQQTFIPGAPPLPNCT